MNNSYSIKIQQKKKKKTCWALDTTKIKRLRKTKFGDIGLVTKSLDYRVTACIHI